MDILETAIEEAAEIFQEALKLVVDAATCEVHSYCSFFNETYENHFLSFDDGMGCKSFDLYRKHDSVRIATILSCGSCNHKIYSPFRSFGQCSIIDDLSTFLQELEDALPTSTYGYINIEAYKYDPCA